MHGEISVPKSVAFGAQISLWPFMGKGGEAPIYPYPRFYIDIALLSNLCVLLCQTYRCALPDHDVLYGVCSLPLLHFGFFGDKSNNQNLHSTLIVMILATSYPLSMVEF
jgi:hypothetical protein